MSSVMGLYPPKFVARLKAHNITWFASVSTVAEARAAEAAGADVVAAQEMEAGGHRGCFAAARAEQEMVGLFALLPAVVDAVSIPVVATGGIADGRGVAAALVLGASAAQIGTGFLRCPEAKIHPAWAAALADTLPEQTAVNRVFSGRAGPVGVGRPTDREGIGLQPHDGAAMLVGRRLGAAPRPWPASARWPGLRRGWRRDFAGSNSRPKTAAPTSRFGNRATGNRCRPAAGHCGGV